MAATLREYLVSLGAEVDQKSFNKFKAALHTSSLTVAKAGAAMVALTTVLVKTSLSIDETGRKYEAMAKKANKTTDEIRAQETALKTLGKTMDEIKADERLKAQYDSLEKLGKSMSLPGAQSGVQTLRNIVQTVNELRVVGTYAMQWINHYMLSRVRAPLDDLRRRLEKIKDNIKNNLPDLSSKIGNFLGNFLRLVEAGAHGVSDLIAKVGELPDGIKAIGAALSGAFAFNKMGAVGWILAGLTAILGLLDDYYTYKRGGISLLGDLWKSFEDGTTGEYVMEKLGGLLEGIQHFSESFAEIIGGLDFGGMLGGAIEKGGNIISGILNFLFGDNAAQTAAEQQGLIDTLTISVTNVISALGGVLERAMFRDNGEKFGNLITRIFAKIGEYFTADENGNTPLKTLLGAGFDLIENALNGIMDFLLGGLAGLNLDQIGGSINTVIGSVLDLIMTALDRGVKALTGYGDKQGLGGKLLDFIRSLLSNLGTLIKGIPFDQIGANIGSFASELFAKIGDFFSKEAEKAANGDSLIGGLAGTLSKIVAGIVTLISSTLSNIKVEDVRKMANGILDSLENGLKDLATRLTNGEIDLTEIGGNIGEGIGNAIVLGFDFLKTMLLEALAWVTSDEGRSTLLAIGGAIVSGIVAGLNALGDTIGEKIFGEEKWGEMKDEAADSSAIMAGEIQVPGYNQQDLMKLRSENPEEFDRLVKESSANAWQDFMRSTNKEYGLPETYHVTDMTSSWADEAKGLINRAIPMWWQESGDWNTLIRARDSAINNQDTEKYQKVTAAISAFISNFNNSVFGEDLRTAITKEAGYDFFNRRGHEGGFEEYPKPEVDVDNGPAMDAIHETENELNALDGKTVTTTIEVKQEGAGGGIVRTPEKQAHGGFFNRPTNVIVGDDGDEAIIPMTNPSRAKGLIMEMFSRMGSSAHDILASLGAVGGGGGAFGGPGMPASMQPAGMYPSAGGAITSNSGNTVSAPTTINVYGCGDPVAAGNAAAKASENNIIRRVRGCFEQ